MKASIPQNETARMEAMARYSILDTEPEPIYDDITRLAAQLCGTPTALVSLVDSNRQWFKSTTGFPYKETPRELSFCAHALESNELLVVPDSRCDPRFSDNPLVLETPAIRFYAGAPLTTLDGHTLGTLCVIDYAPRTLSNEQREALQALSRRIVAHFELRRQLTSQEYVEEALRQSEQRYRQMVDSASDFIYRTDASGHVVYCNPVTQRLLKYTPQAIIGCHYLKMVDSHWRSRAARFYNRQFARKIPTTYYELPMIVADGTRMWIGQNVGLILQNEEVVGFQAVARDITARKCAEEALKQAHEELEVRVMERTRDLETANRSLQAEVAERRRVEEQVQTQLKTIQELHGDLKEAYDATIEGWARALDLRDKETEGHSRRVTEMTLQMARVIGMDEEEMLSIRRGALLHDIGKMGVPDSILLKPDALTVEEWEVMRKHPTYAYQMLSPVTFLQSALDIPYAHHERWDGSGYPRGLREKEIPLPARIFAVVDVWDALCSDRPYRKGWSQERILQHLQTETGAHFDPEIVALFFSLVSTFEKI